MSHPHPQTHPVLPSSVLVMGRAAKRSLLIAITLLFACSLFAILTFAPPHAVADELAPDAPGSIAGVVKNPNGEPQAKIGVTLYKLTSYQANTWNAIRSTTTGTDGTYRFTLLLVGVYRIGINDPQRIYAPIYYPAAPTLQRGTDLPITGNQLTNIDLTLQPSSQITGIITATDALTMTYLYVDLLQQVEGQSSNYWQTIQSISIPTNSSVYSFTGLSATTYRICANGYNLTFSLSECYDNVYEVSRATDLTLTVGETLSDVNIILGDGADYAQISGRVVSANHEPLADIDVYAMPMAQPWPIQASPPMLAVPIATPAPSLILPIPAPPYYYSGYYGSYYPYYGYFSARTDSQGNYHMPMLTAGSYALYFSDPEDQYAFVYYKDAQSPEEATVVEIVPKQIITDVNVQLEPSSSIIGNFTLLGQAAANAYISAELETPFGWRTVRNGQIDTNTGRYKIGGLPAGIYRVTAYSILTDDYSSYFYQGYFGGNTQETATEITLAVGETKTADIALSGDEQFEGSLTGRVTAGGAPLAGAKVLLYRGSDSCCGSATRYPLAYVFTDAEGRYTVNGLAAGFLQLGAVDPAGIYATTYYTQQAVPVLANSVTIENGKATSGIDFDLPLAGAISGRVTKREGEPVAGLFVSIYKPDQPDPFYGNIPLVSSETRTDADGRYTVKGLHASDYYVCFSQQQDGYGECYGMGFYFPYYGNDSGRVKVVAGATTEGIDLLWGPDLLYYLPIAGK